MQPVALQDVASTCQGATGDGYCEASCSVLPSLQLQPSARPEAATDLLGESLAMYGAMDTEGFRRNDGTGQHGVAGDAEGVGLGLKGAGEGREGGGGVDWRDKKPAQLDTVLAAALESVDGEEDRSGAAKQGSGGPSSRHQQRAQHQSSANQSHPVRKSLQEQDSFERRCQEAGLGGDGPREMPTVGGNGVTPMVYRGGDNAGQAENNRDKSGDSGSSDVNSADDSNGADKDGKEKVDGIKAHHFRPRGRKGVESLRVSYDKELYCWLSDFYVTCLKVQYNH